MEPEGSWRIVCDLEICFMSVFLWAFYGFYDLSACRPSPGRDRRRLRFVVARSGSAWCPSNVDSHQPSSFFGLFSGIFGNISNFGTLLILRSLRLDCLKRVQLEK